MRWSEGRRSDNVVDARGRGLPIVGGGIGMAVLALVVYLMGGERSGLDVGHFPRLGRKIIFGQSGIYAAEDKDLKTMEFGDWYAKD